MPDQLQVVDAPRTLDFVYRLGDHGSSLAVWAEGRAWSYDELARLVAEAAQRFGTGRRLVLIPGANRIEVLVAYLGALVAGHVVLLVPGEIPAHVQDWIDGYDPDVVVTTAGGACTFVERRGGSIHDLHPDLALLMSTSGSTGSAKLVRLSYENIQANADSIIAALGIEPTDRAITTLPMAYSYGLSILHTHLARGASVVLTELSVVDRCFVDLCRDRAVTSLGGVPYTYQLLDRVNFLDQDLPALRSLTQAGGRMPAERIRRYAGAGEQRGWRFFVMYGQTEATARIACLAPDLVAEHPGSIGSPIPGGELSLDPATGELLYSGPNVMLGYARESADLALGRTVDLLRTGDLGRRNAAGLIEIVGRSARFAKVFGLRIDVEAVDHGLRSRGVEAWSTSVGDALVVLAEPGTSELVVRDLSAALSGLPIHAIRVVPIEHLPRHPHGKVNGVAAAAVARASVSALEHRATHRPSAAPTDGAGHPEVASVAEIRAAYATVLGRPDVRADSTFVGLGGDSLSYVELSVRLEALLGSLPADWPTRTVGDLRTSSTPARRWIRLDTTMVVRAVGIVLVLLSHTHLYRILGGAHALLAVAGYNFVRFRLTSIPSSERTGPMWVSIRRLLIPSAICIAAASFITPQVGLVQVAMLNDVLGPSHLGNAWRYWFVEALIQILVVLALLLSVPSVDRAERRWPLAFPLTLLLAGLVTRFGFIALAPGPAETQSGAAVFWLFVLGWLAARIRTLPERIVLSIASACLLHGFFGELRHELVVTGALLALIWVPFVPIPRFLRGVRPALGVVASSSLYIYLTHWQVLHLVPGAPRIAVFAGCIGVGIATWKGVTWLSALARRARAWAAVGLRPIRSSSPAGKWELRV